MSQSSFRSVLLRRNRTYFRSDSSLYRLADFEGFTPRDIDHQEISRSAAKIACAYSSNIVLARNIPEDKSDLCGPNVHHLLLDLNANGGQVFVRKDALHIAL